MQLGSVRGDLNNVSEPALVLHPKCLLTELDDGTGVVLNLESKFYHTLNATAVALWRGIEQGIAGERALARLLVSQFEVEETQALRDVKAALLEFEREGFLPQSAPRP